MGMVFTFYILYSTLYSFKIMYMISPENIKNTENEFLYFLLFLAFIVVKNIYGINYL